MSLQEEILTIVRAAVKASRDLLELRPEQKREILEAMADSVKANVSDLLYANSLDLAEARRSGCSHAFLDRLELTEKRIDSMVQGIREIACFRDPVGTVISEWERPNGIRISKVRVPLGVIGFIYESRPNVTSDAAALCFKSSNAVILRGGKEALNSNAAIVRVLQEGGEQAGLPRNAVQLIPTVDREAVRCLVEAVGLVDLVIPRGGEGLIKSVVEMAKVPVLKHYKGVCHTYVDEHADIEMALTICENAKCQRPGVCNAMETLLVHQAIAESFLRKMDEVFSKRRVEIRGDETTCRILPRAVPAQESDWYEEYEDLILSVRVVPSVEAAAEHVVKYGSGHSEAIISNSLRAQEAFVSRVNSAAVLINASTRLVDGGEFGLGAEIGISTDKFHARGPMGVEELTTYKYVVLGAGQIRE